MEGEGGFLFNQITLNSYCFGCKFDNGDLNGR